MLAPKWRTISRYSSFEYFYCVMCNKHSAVFFADVYSLLKLSYYLKNTIIVNTEERTQKHMHKTSGKIHKINKK